MIDAYSVNNTSSTTKFAARRKSTSLASSMPLVTRSVLCVNLRRVGLFNKSHQLAVGMASVDTLFISRKPISPQRDMVYVCVHANKLTIFSMVQVCSRGFHRESFKGSQARMGCSFPPDFANIIHGERVHEFCLSCRSGSNASSPEVSAQIGLDDR